MAAADLIAQGPVSSVTTILTKFIQTNPGLYGKGSFSMQIVNYKNNILEVQFSWL